MELLRSTLLRVPHAFSTRAGGVSQGPFSTLNTSLSVGDDPSAVAENLRRFARALGVEPPEVITAHQVHGLDVLEVEARGEGEGLGPRGTADALISSAAGLAVGVRTADCLPILIEDPIGRQVAAVHAGWRGVIGDLVARTVMRLEARGGRAAELRVAIGPAIGPCCFEVDGELPTRFRAAFGDGVVRTFADKERVHLDLAAAVRLSLLRVGVSPAQIDVLPPCTRCDPRFFSHRRDHGHTGRHLSAIRCVF